jgi:putative membrane protein
LISEDSVTDIHRRWYFTLINPSSYRTSAAIALIAALGIIVINYNSYPGLELTIHLVIAFGITIAGFFLDLFLLRGTPSNKITKVIHVAAFSSSLWLVTIMLGILANNIFGKNSDILTYSLGGMFIASSLRYGIFVSVFGSRIIRSILIAFVLPAIFFFSILPISFSSNVEDHLSVIIIGSSIFAIGIVWSVLADRAGYPYLKSTFSVLQAFLSAWTENKQEKMEDIFDSRSIEDNVRTRLLKFERVGNKQVFVVLPDIHPGPFNPIGGSNLPQKVFNFFDNNAIVLHSISDHSKNLPTTIEVNKYLESLKKSEIRNSGAECTLPVQTQSNDFSLTCIDFRSSVLMIISKDGGMEDLPYTIREKIEQFAKDLGYSDIMVADAHNALGSKISDEEETVLTELAIKALEKLKEQKYYSYEVGYSNSLSSGFKFAELGGAGIGVLNIRINNQDHLIGWSDSNNLINGLRIQILRQLKEAGINMLEICSSDTHSSSGKRTRQGYYALGNVTTEKDIVAAFIEISQNAMSKTFASSFSYLDTYSQVKLMGRDQFDNYASALNKSMNITKVSLAITVIFYVAMLIIS